MHEGKSLQKFLKVRGIKVSEYADAMGVERQTPYTWFAKQKLDDHILIKTQEKYEVTKGELFKYATLDDSVLLAPSEVSDPEILRAEIERLKAENEALREESKEYKTKLFDLIDAVIKLSQKKS